MSHRPHILRISLLWSAVSLFGTSYTASAQDLTGYWDLRTPTANGDGTFRDTFLRLQQSGTAISGELIRRPHGFAVTGTFKAGTLRFASVPPTENGDPISPGGQVQTTYEGTLANGKLVLSVHGHRGEVRAVAERVDKAATEPPARLPLPALKTLPDNGLARTPPMGWNSWNKFADLVDDAAVRGMADAMVSSGMRDAGYTYINIDDTWGVGARRERQHRTE